MLNNGQKWNYRRVAKLSLSGSSEGDYESFPVGDRREERSDSESCFSNAAGVSAFSQSGVAPSVKQNQRG